MLLTVALPFGMRTQKRQQFCAPNCTLVVLVALLATTSDMLKYHQAMGDQRVTGGAYTGYLGSSESRLHMSRIYLQGLSPSGLRIVDPAMADGGKLYPAFDMDFVEVMKSLVAVADVTLPNITEASLLTGG